VTRIERETFLHEIESVQAGLSTRDIVEQSACVVFDGGRVVTYNDEVSCRAKTSLAELTGAVKASLLLSFLLELPDDVLDVAAENGSLILKGKHRRVKVSMEADILLPYRKNVGQIPKEGWSKLPEEFNDAVNLVQDCASKDESLFGLTCIHVTPKWIEASDRYQLARYKLATGFASNILIKRDSLKHVAALGMTEVIESEAWIHFRNPARVVLSCRKYVEDYNDLAEFLKVEGEKMSLPKSLGEVAKRAAIASKEAGDGDYVRVEVSPGAIRVTGRSEIGEYVEERKVAYKGPRLRFMASPAMLMELNKKGNECVVNESRLKVNGGPWAYVACLEACQDKEKKDDAE